ncbi:MAG TPA: hypothetical protein PLE09_03270 [Caldisericia bacterium]|jgi:hypothetical protein|nr:hypothetical protein [Caldisericia bacterium]
MNKKGLFFSIFIILISIVVLFFSLQSRNPKFQENLIPTSFKNSFFYRMYSWNKHYGDAERYYDYEELSELTKNSLPLFQSKDTPTSNTSPEDKNNSSTLNESHDPIASPWAQIFASLTGSTGSLGISGKAKNASFVLQGTNKGNSFQQGSGPSFSIDLQSTQGTKKISITSPAFATNKVLQSLTIGIDPYSMYMTLNGRIQLDLPGDIVGTVYNTTNGSSSSATLQDGYFSVSVPLSNGSNQITASGKWMTIELQFPGISVTIS